MHQKKKKNKIKKDRGEEGGVRKKGEKERIPKKMDATGECVTSVFGTG